MTVLPNIQIIPVPIRDDFKKGDLLAETLVSRAGEAGTTVETGDVIVVTQKVVSKVEGRIVFVGEDTEKKTRVIEAEAVRIVRRRGGLIIAETVHGFVCANAGVDSSNMDAGWVCLLPVDPDLSARRLRARIKKITGGDVGVIISDTFGRPWREGQTNVAIGVAGMDPFLDYRGKQDHNNALLHATQIAIADELAASAELVMGKSDRVPVAVIRGVKFARGRGNARMLVRSPEQDLFR
ncbi:MAG TPA: coenzyme F420-0:L-glutamate ligase [Actinomycetota bacterium]|nr:coenzyme F420-0:L-glutamate ligase [Actinomycetota bacterium]